MAKKKGNSSPAKVNPVKYIKEKARSFPVATCYLADDMAEGGMAQVIVTRDRGHGKFVVGCYLIDTYCLGVKDTFFMHDADEHDIDDLLDHLRRTEVQVVTYNHVHNLIYGAVAFAEEGGIEPHKDFSVTEYILDEDSDDVPLEEFDFGRNGKHLLVVNPDGKERKYLGVLKENLGEGNFDYILPYGIEDYNDDYDDEPYYEDKDDEDWDEDEEFDPFDDGGMFEKILKDLDSKKFKK